MLDLYEALVGPISALVRTILLGVLAYTGLVLLLRASGKRTLSKLNAFDLVVTVALGSSLATILLSSNTALSQGLVAYVVLIGMQWMVAWTSVRWRWFGRLVKASPTLVFYRGELLSEAMRREWLTVEELRAAARSAGVERMETVDAIVLESDGTLSVLQGRASDVDVLVDVNTRGAI